MPRMRAILPSLLALVITAAAAKLPSREFPIWEGPAPGARGNTPRDIPTLTPYAPGPGKASGALMIVCPGGGYGGLAQHEGRGYAEWLIQHGVTCLVLKYRLGSAGYRHPIMWQDISRAVRLARAHAKEWGLDPERIGVMGSSAGGHLVSTLVAHFDKGDPTAKDPIKRVSSRPDLAVLCYPVISMGRHTHQGSRRNLLGDKPTPELVKMLSNELQVQPDSPPCFIWHTWEDRAVKVENSLLFASALRRQGVKLALHIYERGRHGIGLGGRDGKLHPWTNDLLFWLRQRKFVP